jgi:tryptophan-rich sensory protein
MEARGMDGADRRGGTGWLALLGWVLLSLGAGFAGAWAGMPDSWYRSLAKPAGTPPNWVFGPVWTTLYILIGLAMGLVWWRRERDPAGVGTATRFFLAQLALNAAWSWLFFGLHRPDMAFVELVVLWVVVLLMLVSFLRVRPVAGLLIVPYLAWLTYAGWLNAGTWLLNPAMLGR